MTNDFLCLLFLLCRVSFLLPLFKTTKQRCCILNTFCFEAGHRTGGRLFSRSRTVGDNRLVTRKLVYVIEDLA
jgi:hypothetical protein